MAGMKSWLEKIKNRILKKNLNDDLLKSKIQREKENAKEFAKEKELPDLITPTSEDINEIQREEAMKVKERHEMHEHQNKQSQIVVNRTTNNKILNIKNQHLKHVFACQDRRRMLWRSNPNR